MELTIECQKRPAGSKPRALRRAGLIPANLYGHKGTESIALTLNAKTAERLLKVASVNNTIIPLKITDMRWSGNTLLREVQRHPAKGFIYHLSFFSVAAQETVDVDVPLHVVGEAPGVKQEGGALDVVMTELQVRCAPDNIPEAIEVNISQLHQGDVLYLRDLVLPEGVTALNDPEQAVVSILAPQITPQLIEAEDAEEAASAGATEADAAESA
ncbi:MAG: 50S ribosomal protein L25/general stress protein Ctc [Chroococcidiopsidaceae cyanobacterium CP_BM_ER_R8_30]|nr:50S ribosomal protein L25/general stress protein Ctc [Chroococcidiopsidaceae cyanobacterium CP_BM_ER_R8_30]